MLVVLSFFSYDNFPRFAFTEADVENGETSRWPHRNSIVVHNIIKEHLVLRWTLYIYHPIE